MNLKRKHNKEIQLTIGLLDENNNELDYNGYKRQSFEFEIIDEINGCYNLKNDKNIDFPTVFDNIYKKISKAIIFENDSPILTVFLNSDLSLSNGVTAYFNTGTLALSDLHEELLDYYIAPIKVKNWIMQQVMQ